MRSYGSLTVVSSAAVERAPFVGSRMRVAYQWVMAQVYAHVVAAGYDDLSRAQIAMFRYPTPDGLRPSQLAAQLLITKQSVNDLLGEMEERGYLVRAPDPSDRRARVIRLTAKGRQLEQTVYDGAQSAERAIADLLGPRQFTQLRRALETVVSHISETGPRREAPNGLRRNA
jgi:DNA-binding MarR family transcriptional regulator